MIKPPVRQQGYVTRGVLEDAMKSIRRDIEDGGVTVPEGKTPKGTGFRHITDDVEDAQAKTVSTTDIDDHAVSYIKIQNVSASNRFLVRKSPGPGVIEEADPEEARGMLGFEAQAHIPDAVLGTEVATINAILDLLEAIGVMEP